MTKSAFKLRSGNSPLFKMIGSSPMKDNVLIEKMKEYHKAKMMRKAAANIGRGLKIPAITQALKGLTQ